MGRDIVANPVRKVINWVAVLALGLSLGLGLGCKQKVEQTVATDSEIQAIAQKFPDGPAVLTALEQKDYDAAVAGLAKIQQSLAGSETSPDFAALKQHVKNALMDAAPNDPKADAALNSLRFLTQGR
jgi:uncharacterized protein HemY